jgi:hypothetical protein
VGEAVYHLELRHFPRNLCRFNLSAEQLRVSVLEPWVADRKFELGELDWDPRVARLTVLEGSRLAPGELTMGRGWSIAQRRGRDVTERLLADVGAGLSAGTGGVVARSPAVGSAAAGGAALGSAAVEGAAPGSAVVGSAAPGGATAGGAAPGGATVEGGAAPGSPAAEGGPVVGGAAPGSAAAGATTTVSSSAREGERRGLGDHAADSLGLELLVRIGSEAIPLRDAWGLAAGFAPGASASEALALAERAVASLLRRRLAVLMRGGKPSSAGTEVESRSAGGAEQARQAPDAQPQPPLNTAPRSALDAAPQPLGEEEVAAVLRAPASWSGDGDARTAPILLRRA